MKMSMIDPYDLSIHSETSHDQNQHNEISFSLIAHPLSQSQSQFLNQNKNSMEMILKDETEPQ